MPGARRILLALAFGALLQPSPGVAESSAQLVDFADLTGWEDDDHAAALAVFRNTCMDLRRAGLAGALRHCRDGARRENVLRAVLSSRPDRR
jgi:hypothetical protein